MDTVLMQKEVDKSVLYQGMSIPKVYQKLFMDKLGVSLSHGQSCPIKLMLDGELYDAQLKNQGFNQDKFAGHTDVLQIRYSEQSLIAKQLRNRFKKTYSSVEAFRSNPENKGKHLTIPEQNKEYLVLYATPEHGTIMVDCITNSEFVEETNAIAKLGEIDYEIAIDQGATILIETGIKKVRRLSKAIGNSLKIIYGFKCQICGQYIGERYGSDLIHAHHIDYFTKSMNNNADNIMIVCPNHHGVIHDRNPIFDKETKTYTYPNGYKEGLLINYHL